MCDHCKNNLQTTTICCDELVDRLSIYFPPRYSISGDQYTIFFLITRRFTVADDFIDQEVLEEKLNTSKYVSECKGKKIKLVL